MAEPAATKDVEDGGPQFHEFGKPVDDPELVNVSEESPLVQGLDPPFFPVFAGLRFALAAAEALPPREDAGICKEVGVPVLRTSRVGAAVLQAFWLTHPSEPGGGGRPAACVIAGGGEKRAFGSGRQSGWLV